MTYATPFIGKQAVQIYHPERGARQGYCVSTYGHNGWLQAICHARDIEKTKRDHLEIVAAQAKEPAP